MKYGYPFTPDCIKIVTFLVNTEEIIDDKYDLYFSPLQISIALGKNNQNGTRKNIAVLFKNGYLTQYKTLVTSRNTALYKMTLEQYNKWYDDDDANSLKKTKLKR